jgi:hypothetical protein
LPTIGPPSTPIPGSKKEKIVSDLNLDKIVMKIEKRDAELRSDFDLALDGSLGCMGGVLFRGIESAFEFSYGRGGPNLFEWLSQLSDADARLNALDAIMQYREELDDDFEPDDRARHKVTLEIIAAVTSLCRRPKDSLKVRIDEFAPA